MLPLSHPQYLAQSPQHIQTLPSQTHSSCRPLATPWSSSSPRLAWQCPPQCAACSMQSTTTWQSTGTPHLPIYESYFPPSSSSYPPPAPSSIAQSPLLTAQLVPSWLPHSPHSAWRSSMLPVPPPRQSLSSRQAPAPLSMSPS
ncbi:hypothetical protein BC832DRAFT_554196 [Gaertneriomyces semiglobifer]|nr:hypothetical protein BC832DRAFT_554196 [Gaertneriomyces semiglobifer]